MGISHRVRDQIGRASWIRRMFEEGNRLRTKHGRDAVIDLSLGNPEIEPPQAFRDALRAAVDEDERTRGLHRYMPNAGFPGTRAAVAALLAKETGLGLAGDDVVMCCGAAGGLNVFLKAILNQGDEVVILAPYFPEYDFYIDNHGGVPLVVETRDDFHLDLGKIEAALTRSGGVAGGGPPRPAARVRAILLNSPNNPTGRMYPAADIAALGALLREKAPHVFLVSDEPYRRLVFDGKAYAGVLGAHARAVVVGSHSKDLAVPGERIGFIALSPEIPDEERRELVGAMTFVTRTLGFVNAPALMQRAVASLQGVSVDPREYEVRRDMVCDALLAAGYDFQRPDGAFYLFPRSPEADDVRFVRRLAERLVLTVPGTGFGRPGHFRISFCMAKETIARALPVFAEVAKEYGLRERGGR